MQGHQLAASLHDAIDSRDQSSLVSLFEGIILEKSDFRSLRLLGLHPLWNLGLVPPLEFRANLKDEYLLNQSALGSTEGGRGLN